jgi:beta-1,4-mannosyltransferase
MPGVTAAEKLKVLACPGLAARELNPYTWLLYSQMKAQAEVREFSMRNALRGHYDIVHLHWPELPLNAGSLPAALAGAMQLFTVLRYLRARGAKIVWTIHNLASHDQRHPRLETWFWQQFVRMLDGYICLTNYGRSAAEQRFPALRRLPGFVIPHGHYRDEYLVDAAADPRRALNLPHDARVILFFGKIRDYKNVPLLIRAFRTMQSPKAILLVAGRPNTPDLMREVERAAEGGARVHLELTHVPADQVQFYFRAADLIVLPYREILNSGTALLALSFHRPVLVPALGAMSELARLAGDEWVRTYVGDFTAERLEDALAWAGTARRAAESPLDELQWDRIAARTFAAFQEIVQLSRSDMPVFARRKAWQSHDE